LSGETHGECREEDECKKELFHDISFSFLMDDCSKDTILFGKRKGLFKKEDLLIT